MTISKTVITWTLDTEIAVKNGTMKLPSGQLINMHGSISVFDYANAHYVKAFHGKNKAEAIRRYKASKRTEKALISLKSSKITPKQFCDIAKGRIEKRKILTQYRTPCGKFAIKVDGVLYPIPGITNEKNLDVRYKLSKENRFVPHNSPSKFAGHCIGWFNVK